MTEHGRTSETLQDAVRDYYETHTLDEGALDRLTSISRSRTSRWWPWAVGAALAATLALALLGPGLSSRPPAIEPAVAEVTPRLVAVQIHADWCRRSPEVAPVFADLLTRYGNEPMLFVTLDITDDARREQAKLLSRSLGIPQAFDEPFGSGMIKLIDRESETVLAAIVGQAQAAELDLRIADALRNLDENERPGGGA
ncbi:MAG: thioredoxin family protein [bacterium]|nr:thioredoxin family protein [bacterium]